MSEPSRPGKRFGILITPMHAGIVHGVLKDAVDHAAMAIRATFLP